MSSHCALDPPHGAMAILAMYVSYHNVVVSQSLGLLVRIAWVLTGTRLYVISCSSIPSHIGIITYNASFHGELAALMTEVRPIIIDLEHILACPSCLVFS